MSLPSLPAELRTELLTLRYRKHRESTNLLLVEGISQIKELTVSNWVMRYAITSKSVRPEQIPLNLPLYAVEAGLLGRISELQHPPEVLVCVERPDSLFSALQTDQPIIFTDRIANPGNLGTMFLTGEWFGITQWLIGPGSVDPFSPKVIRAAMGSVPRIKIIISEAPSDQLRYLKQVGMRLVATAPSSTATLKLQSNDCILFGSEAHGLSQEYLDLADERYAISGIGQTESLNVAIAFAIAAYSLCA